MSDRVMTVTEKLDLLSELHARQDILNMEKAKLIEAAVPADVRRKLDEIEAEFFEPAQVVADKIAALRAEIQQDVLATGETLRGSDFLAVYSKGRVTWDTQALEGMAKLIPQIKDARKEGAPSVTIRKA